MQIWEAATARHIFTYPGHITSGSAANGLPMGTVQTLAWSPDSLRMASASQDSTVQVWKTPIA